MRLRNERFRIFSRLCRSLTNRRVALVKALFPFEFSLNLEVVSNLFLSSHKELRVFYQFLVLQLSKITRFREKTEGKIWIPNGPLTAERLNRWVKF